MGWLVYMYTLCGTVLPIGAPAARSSGIELLAHIHQPQRNDDSRFQLVPSIRYLGRMTMDLGKLAIVHNIPSSDFL